jgi:hypothetical protein
LLGLPASIFSGGRLQGFLLSQQRRSIAANSVRVPLDNRGSANTAFKMYHFKLQVATAIAAWVFTSVGQNLPLARDRPPGLHSRGNYDMTELQNKLSSTAKIYYPNSTEFNDASVRWSLLDEPKVNVVVVPGTENDVAETVSALVLSCSLCLSLEYSHG